MYPWPSKRLANGPHLTVHHGRRRNQVGPGLGVGHRGLRQQFQGPVVVYPSVFNDAAMPVVRVLAHANVGDDHHVGSGLLDSPDGFLHDAFRVVALRAQGVFFRRKPEQQDSRNAQLPGLRCFLGQRVQRQVVAARHRLDGLPALRSRGLRTLG